MSLLTDAASSLPVRSRHADVPASIPSPRVLLVDDQPARLLTYESVLEGVGVTCVRAHSGPEALLRLLEQEFAVILLDVSMPGMDGFETARAIREHPRFERTPIIFVTGVHISQLDTLRGYEVGAIDYIAVPIVPEILRSKVALLVELYRRRAQLESLNRELEAARKSLEAERDQTAASGKARLEEREQRYRAIFEHPSELTVVLEAVRSADGAITDWRIRDANANALQALGVAREMVIDRSLAEVMPTRASALAGLCARVLADRTPHRSEEDEGERRYLMCLFPIGENTIVRSGTDITARSRAERNSQQAERTTRAEKEWLAAVLDSLTEEVYFTDPQECYTYANPAAMRELSDAFSVGVSVRELLSRLEVRRPDGSSRPLDEAPPLRSLRGEIVQGEEQIVRIPRTSELRHRQISSAPVRNSAGAIIGAVSIVRDVTVQKRIEAEVRSRQARSAALLKLADQFRTLFEPADLAYAAAQSLGETLAVDRCGYGTIDPVAETITIERDWTAPGIETIAGVLNFRDYGSYIDELKRGETVVCSDAREDPRTRVTAASLAAIRVQAFVNMPVTERGGVVALLYLTNREPRQWATDEIAFIREVAERTRVAVERRRTERQLREADRRKDEFIAILAHELRNPLVPLRTGVELLKHAQGQPNVVDTVRPMMERQIKHMVRLIDDLLDVSRITAGRIELKRENTQLATLLSSAIDANREALTAGQLDLSVDVMDPTLTVNVDPVRFSQIIGNLLQNAIKFTLTGGQISIRATVITGSQDQESLLEVTVADNGIGIGRAQLPAIFDLFAKVNSGGKAAQGGLGIGLALARRLAQLHGGTLEASSGGEGSGSEFTLRLPVKSGVAAEDASSLEVRHSLAGMRLLVVDDNRDGAGAMSMLLRQMGAEVRTENDGAAAVAALSEFDASMVLLDIGMPGMDGYQTCRLIRERRGAAIAVIALTGWAQEQDKRRAAQAGFDAHLTKPADPDTLQRLLTRLANAAQG